MSGCSLEKTQTSLGRVGGIFPHSMKFSCIQVPSPIPRSITNDIVLKGINTSNKLMNSYKTLLVRGMYVCPQSEVDEIINSLRLELWLLTNASV